MEKIRSKLGESIPGPTCGRDRSGECFPMKAPDPPETIESDSSYHSHKPGERRLSEDPVVFPEKESGGESPSADDSEE